MKYFHGDDLDGHESDPVCRIAVCAAEIALKSLVADVRVLVKNAVLQELTPIIDEGGVDAAAATSHRKALLLWFKSTHPLSLDPDTHPALIQAVIKPVDGIMALKATCPQSISLTKFAEDVITHCNAPNPCRRPPFIADGQFVHVTRAAIREVTTFATRQGSYVAKDLELILHDGFVAACHALKINQVPWSEPPVVGRRGAPSTRVAHNVWMSLGAKNPKGPPMSVAIRAHDQTPAAIARRTSQNIIALDNRGDWSALEVLLKSFHTVLHKSVPPREISEVVFTGTSTAGETSSSSYVMEAYSIYLTGSY